MRPLATDKNDPDTPARIAAMREELQRSGWVEDKNVQLDVRMGMATASTFGMMDAQKMRPVRGV